jgi:hypothetical protein
VAVNGAREQVGLVLCCPLLGSVADLTLLAEGASLVAVVSCSLSRPGSLCAAPCEEEASRTLQALEARGSW